MRSQNSSAVLHLGQAIIYRFWFMIPTATFGGFLEVLGWSARLWSSQNPVLRGPFLIQFVNCIWLVTEFLMTHHRISSCILGPTPILAANFVILGLIIERLGASYSRLSPKWCT